MAQETQLAKESKSDLREILARWDREEASIPRWVHVATLAGPAVLTIAILLTILLIQGWEKVAAYFGAATAFIFLMGKPIIFLGASKGLPLGPYELGAIVLYLDTITGIILLYNSTILRSLPWFGKRLASVQRASWAMLQGSRWMRRATWITLVLFIAFPLIGTGAVGGALLAQVIGLGRRESAIGTFVGSALWCAPVAVFVDYARAWLGDLVGSRTLVILSLVFIILLFTAFGFWLRHASRRAREIERQEAEGT